MLAPLWVALSASLVLHLGVLLSPGWALPFEDAPEPLMRLSARLAPTRSVPPVALARPASPAPVKKKAPAMPSAPLVSEPESVAVSQPDRSVETPAGAALEQPATEPAPHPHPIEAPVSATDAVAPAPSFAARWPRTGRIVYRVTRGEQDFVIGQGEHRWEHDGQHYRLQATTETTGLVALFRSVRVMQESRGAFDAAGLRPQEFIVEREGKTTELIRFDAAAGRIVLPRGGSVAFVPAQDMLSLFYQLAQLPEEPAATPLTLATARGIATVTVQIGPVAPLETPLGVRQSVHLKVVGGRQEDRTEVWLDAQTRLPLRILHRDHRGDLFDQTAITIETEPLP